MTAPPQIVVPTPLEEAETLRRSFLADYGAEQKNYGVTSTWASQLGHPCGERYLYFLRTQWEKRAQRNWGFRGEKGNLIHDWWKLHVTKKGYNVVQNEEPLSEAIRSKYGIGGRIDGRVNKYGKKPICYEFKSMNTHTYAKINSVLDMLESKQDYIRAYPAQLQTYLYDKNEPVGLFILCDTETLEWKTILVELDYAYVETLLQKAEKVKLAYDQKVDPNPFPRIPYGSTCKFCDMAHICLPDIKNEGLDFIDEPHLEEILSDRAKLEPAHRDYEKLDAEAKVIAEKIGKDFLLGNSYSVQIKKTNGVRLDTKKIQDDQRIREIVKEYEIPTERTSIKFIPLKISG